MSTAARLRVPAVVAILVVLAALLVVLLRPVGIEGDLDPRSAAQGGSRALAQVLQDQGVSVQAVDRFADVQESAGADATVLVIGSDLLSAAQLQDLLATSDEVVLAVPDAITLEALGLAMRAVPATRFDAQAPSCDLGSAVAAGELSWNGLVYTPTDGLPDDIQLCYPFPGQEDSGSLMVWTHGGGRVVALGSSQALTNRDVDEAGNAAMALWTLGSRDRLVWWQVDPIDPALVGSARSSPTELLPGWVRLVAWQLVLAAVAAIWWRGRRLGRLVPEPLPVVVRSAETAHGRAALYRQAGARDRAATVLRADALRRLALRAGLPSWTPASQVVSAVASSSARPAGWVQGVLAGPPPRDDLSMSRLADDLDHLLADRAGPVSSPADRPSPVERPPTRKAQHP